MATPEEFASVWLAFHEHVENNKIDLMKFAETMANETGSNRMRPLYSIVALVEYIKSEGSERKQKMLDATGHDTNCSYAADPRAKCDCGGKKPRMNINPVDMGVSAPEVFAPALERRITTIGQQLAANKESAIKIAADAAFGEGCWNKALIRAAIGPDGVETYSLQGHAFMEWQGMSFDSVLDGESYKITAVQRWKRLKLDCE